jgi:hypothetical protein
VGSTTIRRHRMPHARKPQPSETENVDVDVDVDVE